MLKLYWPLLAAAFFAATANTVFAAEKVGEATLIKTTVTGAGGTLVTRSPVHRDERIKTSSAGLGEFVFRDGTKFAVGGNSSVVIDKFVFDGSKSVKNLTIKAAKGSFRWISGGSKSSAYKIDTPAGTVGIRGTAFDVYVGAGGTTAVVLFSGAARFCGSNGCRELKRRCDVVVATPRGGVSDPKRLDSAVLKELGGRRSLPFVSGHQALSGRFRVPGRGCLSIASLGGSQKQPAPNAATPTSPNAPDPPDAPDAPDPSPTAGRGNNGGGNGGGDGSPNGRGDAGR
jgi:hypothetical protein